MSLAQAITLALLFAAGPARRPGWEEQWKRARALTAKLDFDAALPLLKELAASPEVPPEPRVQVLLELGLAWVNLGDDAAASATFEKALDFEPAARLPALAPPRAVELLEQARERKRPEPVSAGPPAASPPAQPEPQPAAPSPASPPPAAVVAPPETFERRHFTARVWLTALGAAAFAATGIGLALESQRLASDAATNPRPAAAVDALRSRRDAFSIGAVAAYSVSGVLAVLCAVFLIRGQDVPVTLTAGPAPLGFSLATRLP